MDVLRGFAATRDVEVATARCAAADEHRIVAFAEQAAQRIDAPPAAKFHAHVEDVAALLVDHRIGQAELGNLRAHHAAGTWILVEHDAFVAE